MKMFILGIVIIAIAEVVVRVLKCNPDFDSGANEKSIQFSSYKKKGLLTKTEYAFWNILKIKCDKCKLLICPKVRMEDFLLVVNKKEVAKYRGYIKSRHVDFLICDNNLHILAGVELDDVSHNKESVQKIDDFKNKVFESVNIPLYRIKVAGNSSYMEQIDLMLGDITKQIKNADYLAMIDNSMAEAEQGGFYGV